jgi:hypothetical protein
MASVKARIDMEMIVEWIQCAECRHTFADAGRVGVKADAWEFRDRDAAGHSGWACLDGAEGLQGMSHPVLNLA